MRKPVRSEARPLSRVRLPLPAVRLRIWEAACELVAIGESRDLCAVLAGRFSTSARVVGLCLVIEGLRHQRTAAALRSGILSALELGRDAEVYLKNFEGSLKSTPVSRR
jgi:hypothetical protein